MWCGEKERGTQVLWEVREGRLKISCNGRPEML